MANSHGRAEQPAIEPPVRGPLSGQGPAARAATNGPGRRLSELEGRCLDQGITLTWQRHRVLTVLAGAKEPMNVDEVWSSLRREGMRIGRATVNTMLRLMSEAGIVETSYSSAGRRVFR